MISLYHLHCPESSSFCSSRHGLQDLHPNEIYDPRRTGPFPTARDGQELG